MAQLGSQSQFGLLTRKMQSAVFVDEVGDDLGHADDNLGIGHPGKLFRELFDGRVEVGLRHDVKRLEIDVFDRSSFHFPSDSDAA